MNPQYHEQPAGTSPIGAAPGAPYTAPTATDDSLAPEPMTTSAAPTAPALATAGHHGGVHSTTATGRHGHMLAIPRPIALGLAGVTLLLAIILLGLSAYIVHYITYDGASLTLFTALATMIISVYIIVSMLFVPLLYNYWAILALQIFGVIFWFVSFIVLSVDTSRFDSFYRDRSSYYDYYDKRDLVKRSTSTKTYRGAMIAASVFGAIEFVLFVAGLVLTAIYLQKHRTNGGHSIYHSDARTTVGNGTADHEMKQHHQPQMAEVKDDSLPLQHPPPLSHNTAV